MGGEVGGDEVEVLSEAALRGRGREGGGREERKQATVFCFRMCIEINSKDILEGRAVL